MNFDKLCKAINYPILQQTIRTAALPVPSQIVFLLEPCTLSADQLYMLDASNDCTFLSECSASEGASVLCAGSILPDLPIPEGINFAAFDCSILPLYNRVSDVLKAGPDADNTARSLRKQFAKLVESRSIKADDAQKFLSDLPYPLKNSFCIIVARPGSDIDLSNLSGGLLEIMPYDNIITYKNMLIILHSYIGYTHPPKYPAAELCDFAKNNNILLGISFGSRRIDNLNALFFQAINALRSGPLLFPERYVFPYDDTMLYTICGLGVSACYERYGDDCAIVLGTPALNIIIKHDMDEKLQLIEILYQYLINNGNIDKIAASVFMHPNTVRRRIKRIEEIIGPGFTEDGLFQTKLLITYYLRKYMNRGSVDKYYVSPLTPETERYG